MSALSTIWRWPSHSSLSNRLRSSEFHRLKSGRLPAAPRLNCEPVAPVRYRHCRWPYGEPGAEDFRFCGEDTAAGCSYCSEHRAIAYQPAKAA